MKYYVTRWKDEYSYSFSKIRQSLRSFHFDDYQSALKFFKGIDSSVYRANLKSFDESTKRSKILESV